jgi:hypothetical protein
LASAISIQKIRGPGFATTGETLTITLLSEATSKRVGEPFPAGLLRPLQSD